MTTKIKTLLLIILFGSLAVGANAQDFSDSDFDNGSLGPFNECTTAGANYAKVVSGRLKTYWAADEYRGTRVYRGAEVCSDWETLKEGWYGMTMTVGSDYPLDRKGGVAQIFQFVNSSFWTWAAMLQMDNGDLTIIHRDNGGTSRNTEEVVYSNFPIAEEMDIVMHFVLSAENQGLLKIWINGQLEYSKTNINFGFGSWNNDDTQTGDDTRIELKAGQYNFDDSAYRSGETRTVYYDNLSWWAGSNGYDIVNPDTVSKPPVVPPSGDFVSMRKSNANTFAIDGNNGGADAQNVYLWAFDGNNQNQHWKEIDRGDGYYAYQKRGTNFCLDGNRGGANGQSVYLWTCGTNNVNQHWKKINVGGQYRLEKRNTAFSLDGGRGGANRQDLYLWGSNSANPNQLWDFTSH